MFSMSALLLLLLLLLTPRVRDFPTVLPPSTLFVDSV
jgi:hypothetical protein